MRTQSAAADAAAAALALFCALSLSAAWLRAGDSPEKPAASPKLEMVSLNAADRDALKKLFDQLAQAFLKEDADACLKLFAPLAAERNKLVENIREEFEQSRYARFEIVELRTSEAEQDPDRKHVYTVDAVLRMETRAKKPDNGELTDERRAYTTTYPFVVQRMGDGVFALRFSEFFKTLGLRRGPGILLHGVGVAGPVVGFCVLLVLYVWMGWEAWRERPRARFWRYAALLPVLGTLGYFLARLLPRWLKKS